MWSARRRELRCEPQTPCAGASRPCSIRYSPAHQTSASSAPNYFTVMLPALTVVVGNAVALRIKLRLPVDTVTVGSPEVACLRAPIEPTATPLLLDEQ